VPIKIGFKVEGGERVMRDLQRAGEKARPAAARKVREASFGLEKRIKSDMPVDSGRARASWGHWTPAEMVAPDSDASKSDAHWAEQDGGLTVEQGSNLEYIAALNEGHSKQAPAGFIDKAVEAAQRALVNAIDRMLKELF
jgi:hypothetical protein